MDSIKTVLSDKIENLKKMKVTKVDGEVVNFYPYKIALVVETLTSDAALQTSLKEQIFNRIADDWDNNISTADIRQVFQEILRLNKQAKLLERYEAYREKDIKKWKTAIDPQYKLNQLFNGNDMVVHENANKDSNIFSTRRDLTAGMVG